MIKGNIIIATTSGSNMPGVNTITGESKEVRFNNMDLYVTTVTEETTLIGRDNQVVKAKPGWFIVKCNCHRFYYACSPKTSIQDLMDAWNANEIRVNDLQKLQTGKVIKEYSDYYCNTTEATSIACESDR